MQTDDVKLFPVSYNTKGTQPCWKIKDPYFGDQFDFWTATKELQRWINTFSGFYESFHQEATKVSRYPDIYFCGSFLGMFCCLILNWMFVSLCEPQQIRKQLELAIVKERLTKTASRARGTCVGEGRWNKCTSECLGIDYLWCSRFQKITCHGKKVLALSWQDYLLCGPQTRWLTVIQWIGVQMDFIGGFSVARCCKALQCCLSGCPWQDPLNIYDFWAVLAIAFLEFVQLF